MRNEAFKVFLFVNTSIQKLANQRVLVIGDIILDEYLIGKATRMSREAPIPVLEFEAKRLIPGGAANPAANIAALGSQAIQVGVIGDDPAGEQLQQILGDHNIITAGIVCEPGRPTTVKTRIMAQMGLRFPQQVARLDTLSREPIAQTTQQHIEDKITDSLEDSDALLFSDYHVGMLTESLIQSIKAQASQHLLTADAQGELSKYRGFSVVKCNADEASSYLQHDIQTDTDFAQAAIELYQQLDLSRCMVITRGSDGITLATANGTVHHCPAPDVTDVFDTVGAGDTTIAVLTLAIAAGIDYQEAATLANIASGLVVRRVGNYTPSLEEIHSARSGSDL